MLRKMDSGGGSTGDSGGQLLKELEALRKALYRNGNPNPSPRSISAGKSHLKSSRSGVDFSASKARTSSEKENPPSSAGTKGAGTAICPPEKKSLWNWKPLRALAHVRHRRFICSFSVHVLSVEGLSPGFNGKSLCVSWKRKDGGLQSTKPSKVIHGVANFDENLSQKCCVNGSVNGPSHIAKYEAKQFVLYVSMVGSPDHDLGKHRIDLTRLLPDTFEELAEDKRSGSWTTNFKLSGKAKGAILIVTFGFSVLGDEFNQSAVESSVNKNNLSLTKSKSSNLLAITRPASLEKPKFASSSVVGLGHEGQNSLLRSGSTPSMRASARNSPPKKSLYNSREETNSIPGDRPSYGTEFSALGISGFEGQRKTDIEVSLEKDAEGNTGIEENEFGIVEQGIEIVDSLDNSKNSSALAMETDTASESAKLEMSEGALGSVNIEEGLEQIHENVDPKPASEATIDRKEIEEAQRNGEETVDILPFEKDSYSDEKDLTFMESEERENLLNSHELKDVPLFTDESALEELNAAFGNDPFSDDDTSEITLNPSLLSQPQVGTRTDLEKSKIGRSYSLDDLTESVADEFLNLLGIEHSPFSLSSESDPESPRERLWKQFEKDSLASGGLFAADVWNGGDPQLETEGSFSSEAVSQSDMMRGEEIETESFPLPRDHLESQTSFDLDEEFELSSIVHAAEAEHEKAVQAMKSKTRAKVLEDEETEFLMREWGLNENAFQSSPPNSAGGFGSPIHLPPEEPLELPSLGEGLGSFVRTRDGGFVRSMNPALFKSAKNNGSLIMQVSSPVVVPAEMGSGIMEILHGLASVGIEKLTVQAKKLMPLEDITGKSILQVAHEATPFLEAYERQDLLQHQADDMDTNTVGGSSLQPKSRRRKKESNKCGQFSSSSVEDSISEFVCLEDLAPCAMDKIEALSMEGLKIQSGMSGDDELSNVCAQSIGEISALEGMRAKTTGALGLEGTAGLQLLDLEEGNEPVDGLMGLSITLDEWMKLDSGIVDDEEESNSRMSRILAAHHAKCTDLIGRGKTADKASGKNSGRRWGFLGNTLTVALLVQLRDPLRNYEPVGAPMLALIQAERVVVPPKPKIYSSVSDKGNSEEIDEPEPLPEQDEKKEEIIPQFKITEVHVAGLKTEVEKKKGWGWGWGTGKQQQTGSRWLLASGMGKANKNPFMKSKPVSKSLPQHQTTTVKPGDTLWSISSRVHGTGAKWKELAELNPHIRNPNVIFPNETIRLS
ncbi:protein PLASTID MOVEMENT IMPAIRED 1-RELATED 1 [Nymphaea colorata]|nr:protein PLASTID MOVEMENT IMPAIRED 1-RELATED 1 [Nymphaea colorata]XP_031488012.1 protein PLASTID MOVEMENT IMPAIRED 1-RELATED 1 [Nymphaea colorata]XP_031488013.1 protein PLASTID MOVEMENT IMPAIRED 1-RELATED 1 [Nymphaea colorata]